MLQRSAMLIIGIVLASTLVATPAAGQSLPVTDTTMTIAETGAIYFKVVQTIPEDRNGVTGFHFELQKLYRPGNVSVRDLATGKPLAYDVRDMEGATAYDVYFDRPYFNGYKLVVEYDNHKRIVDEGGGLYSFGMRPGVDIRRVERIYTIVFPQKNFTYVGHNQALDTPVSVDTVDGRTVVLFKNVSSAPADYAWEIRFRAIGIRDEVRAADSRGFAYPSPEAPVAVAVLALLVVAMARRR